MVQDIKVLKILKIIKINYKNVDLKKYKFNKKFIKL